MKIVALLIFRNTEFHSSIYWKVKRGWMFFFFFFQIQDFQGMVNGLFLIIFPQLNLKSRDSTDEIITKKCSAKIIQATFDSPYSLSMNFLSFDTLNGSRVTLSVAPWHAKTTKTKGHRTERRSPKGTKGFLV